MLASVPEFRSGNHPVFGDTVHFIQLNINRRTEMDQFLPVGEYYYHRIIAWRLAGRDLGEVSATTVVLAAALIALAISVGVVVSSKVRDKANSLNLG